MNILEIIEKKKKMLSLNEQEINFIVNGYLNNQIDDIQMAAFLMAYWFNPANDNENFYLTKSILDSSIKIDMKLDNKIVIDKHSTGGVGDSVSLIICPLLASLDVYVGKISGRGLGHTGGTLDKLDSINVNTEFDQDQAKEILEKYGFVIMSQSKNIVPADKKIYALRDTTRTVDHVGLVASSIMSKKLSLNSNCIFLDVKVGSGSFLPTLEKAKEISIIMKNIAKKFNRDLKIHITDMNEPLSNAVGNKIEIVEALDFLNNKSKNSKLNYLIYNLCSDILIYAKKAKNKDEAFELISNSISSKKAYNLFIKYLTDLGANYNELVNNSFWKPKYKYEVFAKSNGYLEYLNAADIGMTSTLLGAGRIKKDDKLDFDAGLYLNKKNNDNINKDDLILTAYSSNPIKNEVIKKLESLFTINKNKKSENKVIYEVL